MTTKYIPNKKLSDRLLGVLEDLAYAQDVIARSCGTIDDNIGSRATSYLQEAGRSEQGRKKPD